MGHDGYLRVRIGNALTERQRQDLLSRKATAHSGDKPEVPREIQQRRLPSTITSRSAAAKVHAYLEASPIGPTAFATKAGITDRTLRTFKSTGKARRATFIGIAKAMGTTLEDLLHE